MTTSDPEKDVQINAMNFKSIKFDGIVSNILRYAPLTI